MKQYQHIIDELSLQPHPEGGFYKETYRSEGQIQEDSLSNAFKGTRNYSTCIYFLLTSDNFSAFHRIKQDEIWHFYKGSPIILHSISEEGEYNSYMLGNDLRNNQSPQIVIPAGHWFAAEVIGNDAYSLVGCTVSPGFSYDDFEMANRNTLCSSFPDHEELIRKFTR